MIYILTIFAMILASMEGVAHTDWAKDNLVIPATGTKLDWFDAQLNYLDELAASGTELNCIIIGSSVPMRDFNPTYITQGYASQTGEPLTCFNMSLVGLQTDSIYYLGRYLVEKYEPDYLIYGITSIDLVSRGTMGNGFFQASPWYHYIAGELNWRGYLTEHSLAYRYYLRYRNWLSADFVTNLEQIQIRHAQVKPNGHSAFTYQSFDVRTPLNPATYPIDAIQTEMFADFAMVDEYIDYFDQLLELDETTDTQVIIIDLPIHATFMNYYINGNEHQQYLDLVATHTAAHKVSFWQLSNQLTIPDAFWQDRHHLTETGATYFSYWLGMQLGSALANQEKSGDILELPMLELTPEAHTAILPGKYGLNETYSAEYDTYLPEFAAWDGVYFNPTSYNFEPSYYQIAVATHHNFIQTEREGVRRGNYLFIYLLEQMKTEDQLNLSAADSEILAQWYNSLDPHLLIQLGINYVVVSDSWASTLTPEQHAILQDTTRYQLNGLLKSAAVGTDYSIYVPLPQ